MLYSFEIALMDTDRGIEQAISVRTARHQSETMQRVWLRVLAYAWRWEERLQFGPGLCDPEAPDIFADDLTGRVTQWIRVGKADPEKLDRVANTGAAVSVLFENTRQLELCRDAKRAMNLAAIDPALIAALPDDRRLKLQITIAGEHFYLDLGGTALDGGLTRLVDVA